MRQELMLQDLEQLCSVNSGTTNLQGLALLLKILQKKFKSIGDETHLLNGADVQSITMKGERIHQHFGANLYVRKRPHLKRRVLLCGHMDTVFAKEHPFQHLTQLDSHRLNGPGVADMKGGLVVMLHALMAFEQTPYAEQLGWDVFINADEEMGSLSSAPLFASVAPPCQIALVYEPTMTESGTLAKNRKGNGKITLIATGLSAHAGRNFEDGRNAICYLAEIITSVQSLNAKRSGVSLNVGLIHGGTSLNTVPDKAVAKVDVRIQCQEDKAWVIEQLEGIQKKHQKKGYSLDIDPHFDRPVKRVNQATEQLFTRLQSVGQQQGLTIDWKDSGGCCDGNNLAHHGLAVLDTLGVRGGNIHTSEEYIIIESLVERALLSQGLLIDLAQGQLERILQENRQ